jgi:hypothetical protein
LAVPNATRLNVEVTHRFPAPNCYGWALRLTTDATEDESRTQFDSWERASQAGKLALEQLRQRDGQRRPPAAEFPAPTKEAWWPMLNFPNQSRSFDQTRRAVRFWGHDSAMEWSFFVTEAVLRRLQPNVPRDEASLLLAFDAHRAAIHAAAMRAYERNRKGSYELAVSDF